MISTPRATVPSRRRAVVKWQHEQRGGRGDDRLPVVEVLSCRALFGLSLLSISAVGRLAGRRATQIASCAGPLRASCASGMRGGHSPCCARSPMYTIGPSTAGTTSATVTRVTHRAYTRGVVPGWTNRGSGDLSDQHAARHGPQPPPRYVQAFFHGPNWYPPPLSRWAIRRLASGSLSTLTASSRVVTS